MKKTASTLLGLVLTASAIWLFYLWKCPFLAEPNDWMIGAAGDGLKNHFTALWHVRWDADAARYSGMNYPYGDHVLFADAQPILTNLLRWVEGFFPYLKGNEVGVLLLALFLYQVLGGVFLFLIFRRLHLPVWFSSLAAVGLTLLSPQVDRITGHFALACTAAMPLILYLLCRFEERDRRKRVWSLLIGLSVVALGMMHFYFFGWAAMFLSFYGLFQFLKFPTFKNGIQRAAHWFVQVILPMAALNFWLDLGPSVDDRPTSPWGYLEYRAKLQGTFLPAHLLEKFDFFQKWLHTNNLNVENRAWLGALGVAATFWLLARKLRINDAAWEEEAHVRRNKSFLKGILSAGVLTLVFAHGLPFLINENWLNWAGPFKQFRGTGRFAWSWFYVGNVLFFYMIWQKSRRSERPLVKTAWLAVPLFILFLDAFYFQSTRKLEAIKSLDKLENIRPDRPDHWLRTVDFSRFQAILPIPYYHNGSENIWLTPINGPRFEDALVTSQHAGIPNMGVELSRVSLSQTIKSLQLTRELCEMPAILDDLPDSRPLALLVDPERLEGCKTWFRPLMRNATPVYSNEMGAIFSLEIDSIRSAVRQRRAEIKAEMVEKGRIDLKNGWKSDAEGPFFFTAGWNQNLAEKTFLGAGALVANFCDSTRLYSAAVPKGGYTVSFWQFIGSDGAWASNIIYREVNLATGKIIQKDELPIRNTTKTIVGQWAMYEFFVEIKDDGSRLDLVTVPKKGIGCAPLFYDELMIRQFNHDYFRETAEFLIKNNFCYRK